MNSFKDFNIRSELKSFGGEKIKIHKVLNREIEVQDYKIGPSRIQDRGSGKCLDLQVKVDGEQRIIFTGSTVLMGMIEQVPKERFPFKTTIVQIGERFEFT